MGRVHGQRSPRSEGGGRFAYGAIKSTRKIFGDTLWIYSFGRRGVMEPTTLDVSPSTTITVNGRIDPDPWDDETYLRVDEELFDMVRFVRAWIDPETGRYCETWEIKPRSEEEA